MTRRVRPAIHTYSTYMPREHNTRTAYRSGPSLMGRARERRTMRSFSPPPPYPWINTSKTTSQYGPGFHQPVRYQNRGNGNDPTDDQRPLSLPERKRQTQKAKQGKGTSNGRVIALLLSASMFFPPWSMRITYIHSTLASSQTCVCVCECGFTNTGDFWRVTAAR